MDLDIFRLIVYVGHGQTDKLLIVMLILVWILDAEKLLISSDFALLATYLKIRTDFAEIRWDSSHWTKKTSDLWLFQMKISIWIPDMDYS